MRFLYFSDSHLYHKSPFSRVDEYPSVMLDKLSQVVSIANDKKVDFVIFGGDLLHKSSVPIEYTCRIIDVLNKLNMKLYMIAGNHDLRGHNFDTLNTTTLGILSLTGVISIIDDDKNALELNIDGVPCRIEGKNYRPHYDKDVENYSYNKYSDYNVLVCHGMLSKKPLLDVIDHVLIDDINHQANLTLCGHEHKGFGKYTSTKGNTFINIGSIARVDKSVQMQNHKPSILICKLSNVGGEIEEKFKKIPLDIRPFNEVFREDSISNEFISSISELCEDESPKDVSDILCDITDDDDVVALALKTISDMQVASGIEAMDDSTVSSEIIIDKVTLINFKAHENTTIEFTKGLNTIVGDNSVGKSTILKAINWVVNDSPKGSAFIRTGAKKCEVKLSFVNGTYIRKTRNSSSSTYYLFDGTSETEYKGFANRVPVEITNAHQMPLVDLYGEKISLNYGAQLDPLFLISQSKASRADAIGKLTKTDIYDDSIEHITKAIRKSSKDISSIVDMNNNIEEDINSLHVIENILLDLKTKAQVIVSKNKASEDMYSLVGSTITQLDDINKLNEKINVKVEDPAVLDSKVIEKILSLLKDLYAVDDLKIKTSVEIGTVDTFDVSSIMEIAKYVILLDRIDIYKEDISIEESNVHAMEGFIQGKNNTLTELNNKIKDATCPVCGKRIGD